MWRPLLIQVNLVALLDAVRSGQSSGKVELINPYITGGLPDETGNPPPNFALSNHWRKDLIPPDREVSLNENLLGVAVGAAVAFVLFAFWWIWLKPQSHAEEGEMPATNRSDVHSPPVKRRCKGICVAKWALPILLWMFSCFICMWFLHIGTYYYIQTMDRMNQAYMPDPDYKPTKAHQSLSPGLGEQDVSYGSLQDPLAGRLGWKKVPISTLDAVSAALPVTWLLMTLWVGDLQHFTKVILCNSMLAIGKGVFGMITIVPDSIGWASCKERLGEENLAYFRNEVPDPHTDAWGGLSPAIALLKMEACGPKCDRLGSGVRFCADMMYSGHTYFTCLYALALIELVRWHTRKRGWTVFWQNVAIGLVMFLAVAEQLVEAYLVIKNRFHYTMDIVMAMLLTFLWFTNGSISIAAKTWSHWREPPHELVHEPEELRALEGLIQKYDYALVPKALLRSEGDIWVPICCVPFCCLYGRHHIVDDDTFRKMGADVKQARIMTDQSV